MEVDAGLQKGGRRGAGMCACLPCLRRVTFLLFENKLKAILVQIKKVYKSLLRVYLGLTKSTQERRVNRSKMKAVVHSKDVASVKGAIQDFRHTTRAVSQCAR